MSDIAHLLPYNNSLVDDYDILRIAKYDPLNFVKLVVYNQSNLADLIDTDISEFKVNEQHTHKEKINDLAKLISEQIVILDLLSLRDLLPAQYD